MNIPEDKQISPPDDWLCNEIFKVLMQKPRIQNLIANQDTNPYEIRTLTERLTKRCRAHGDMRGATVLDKVVKAILAQFHSIKISD